MLHAGVRDGGRDGFPYSNTVSDVDSSRARQTDSSSSSMPLRWWHGRESQQGVTLEPQPVTVSGQTALAWRGADFACHNAKAGGRARAP
jgi:hypothetical protein